MTHAVDQEGLAGLSEAGEEDVASGPDGERRFEWHEVVENEASEFLEIEITSRVVIVSILILFI